MKKIIKTRRISNCVCDNEGVITDKELTNLTLFDKAGNVVREEFYLNGQISMLMEATFENGLLVKMVQTDYENQMQQTWEHQYDEFGRKTEKVEHYHTGGFIATKYEYTTEGKLKSEINVDDENEVSGKTEYAYDSIGNLISKTEYDTDDFTTPWITTTYEYDINKNIIKKEEKIGDQPGTTSTFEYDEEGQLLGGEVFYSDDEDLIVEQKVLLDEEGKSIGTTTFYPKENTKKDQKVKRNEQGKIIEEENLVNGNFESLTLIEYNENEDMVLEKYLNPVGSGEFMQWTAQSFDLEYWEKEAEA